MDTREKILNSAREVFLERGYGQATVDEIMQRAGLAKGTLYTYFLSKEELFLSLIEEGWQALQERTRPILEDESVAPFERLRQAFLSYLSFFAENVWLIGLIVDAQRNIRSQIADGYFRRYEERMPVVVRLISSCQEEGIIRRDISPDGLVNTLLSLANGLVYMWFVRDRAYDLVEAGKVAWDVVERGMRG